MANRINSASRLVSLLTSIPNQAENAGTLDVWARVFAIHENDSHTKAGLVAERLITTSNEVELVRNQLSAALVGEDSYAPAITHLQAFLSPLQLGHTWQKTRANFTTDTLVALRLFAEMLPDEETSISAEELASIAALVQELEDLLAESTLPTRLTALIKRHIKMIRRALAEYPIAGAKALKDAAHTALGELIDAKREIDPHKAAPEVGKLRAVWARVWNAADVALKVEQLAEMADKLLSLFS